MNDAAQRKKNRSRWQLTFAGILVAGLLFALLTLTMAGDDDAVSSPGGGSSDSQATWLLLVAVVTPVVGVLGLVSTTVFAWRQDRREVQQSALQVEKLSLEIAHLQQSIPPKQTAPETQNEQS